MSTATETIEQFVNKEYEYGFVTDVEADAAPRGLNEGTVRLTYKKLGIPLREQERLAGVAVDAVFDSVSVATTFKGKLAEMGIIFGSFSEAVQNHPELVQKYL